MLRDAGIEGTTLVHMYINATGVVGNAFVAATSGYEQLDQAALQVAGPFEFESAQNEGENVAVWVSFRESGGSHGQYESALHLLWGEVGRASAQAITIIPDSTHFRAGQSLAVLCVGGSVRSPTARASGSSRRTC